VKRVEALVEGGGGGFSFDLDDAVTKWSW
jgi:hypothetical protein